MKPEARFKVKVVKFLNTLERHWSFKSQEKARRGIPDLVGCLGIHFFALELKASEKDVATPLQLYTLDKIARTGSYARVAYPENWEEIKKELTELSKIN